MSRSHPELIKRLRSRIREFEDRKITGADLSREIYYVAREIADADEAQLRRALEGIGNRIAVLVEQGRSMQVHPKILEAVDQIESELIDFGY